MLAFLLSFLISVQALKVLSHEAINDRSHEAIKAKSGEANKEELGNFCKWDSIGFCECGIFISNDFFCRWSLEFNIHNSLLKEENWSHGSEYDLQNFHLRSSSAEIFVWTILIYSF